MPPKGDTIRGARGGRNRGTGRDSSKSARGRNTRASDVEQSQTPTQTASRARGARGAGGSSRALPTITRGGAGRGHFPGQGGAPSTQDDDEFGDQQQYDDLLQQTQPDQGELSQEQLGQEQQDTYGQEGFGQQAQFGYHQDVFGQDVFSQQQEEQYPDPGRMSGYQYQPAIDPSLDPSLNPSLDPSLDPSPVVHTKRALPRLQHLQARTQQTQTPTRPPYSQSQSAGGLQGSGSGSMRQGLQTQSGSTNPSGRSAGSGYQSHQALQRQRPTNPGSAQRIQSGSGLHQSYSSSSLQSEGVVSPNDFIITKAKRQELRKLMEDGKTLTRKSQMKAAKAISRTPLSPGEKKDYNAKLDRVIRWNTLLIHVNLNLQDVMAFVFGERVETDSSDYEWARNKMLENCRSYKSKVCAQFKSFVEAMTTQDPTLLELSDNGFATKVGEAFTATNYFHCFFFMKNYLNVEGSSSLGKWFLKSIFVNMAVRVRKWQQIKDAREQVGDWNEVLDFFDEVALLPAHDDVDITDFQQLTQKFRNAKESKKRSFALTMQNYIAMGPPPKKQAPVSSSDVRTGADAEEIDEDITEEIDGEGGENEQEPQGVGSQHYRGRRTLHEDTPPNFGLDGAFDDREATPTPLVAHSARSTRFAAGADLRKFNITHFVAPMQYEDDDEDAEYEEGLGFEDNDTTTVGNSFASSATQ